MQTFARAYVSWMRGLFGLGTWRVVFATGVVGTLLILSINQPWLTHLQADSTVYQGTALDLLSPRSWGPVHSEYPPGAQVFFLVPEGISRLFSVPYLVGLWTVNGVLLLLHILLLARLGGARSAAIGLLLFLAAGPISLFRFELLVTFLVLLAVFAARRGWWGGSGFLLGLGTLVKVYPLLLVPLLLTGGGPRARRAVVGVLLGMLLPLGGYLLTGGNWPEVRAGFRYHAEKPVSIHSAGGTAAFLTGVLRGAPPAPVDTHGLYGFLLPPRLKQLLLGALLASLTALLASGVRTRASLGSPHGIALAHAVLAVLLLWQPAFQPQYSLWLLPFLALLGAAPTIGSPRRRGLLLLFTLWQVLTQVIYPLWYTRFVRTFYADTSAPLLVAVWATLTVLLLLYVVLAVWEFSAVAHATAARGARP